MGESWPCAGGGAVDVAQRDVCWGEGGGAGCDALSGEGGPVVEVDGEVHRREPQLVADLR